MPDRRTTPPLIPATELHEFQPRLTAIPMDDRERLIRLEEQIKHMSKNLTEGIIEIKTTVEKLVESHANERRDDRSRIESLEKRVDKIYVYGSVAVFVGGPLISFIIKMIVEKFGG
jgi:uncharacterized protein Yka (UPF0111/DUF47 family)